MIDLRACPQVKSPCPTPPAFKAGQKAAWCADCHREVHNLSALTADEQAGLLRRERAPCVRYRFWTPLAATLALGAQTTAQAQDASSAPAADSTIERADAELLEPIIAVGRIGRVTVEPIFLESELPESFDDAEPSSSATRQTDAPR